MIDFHCHIIPGIDDGAQTLDESIRIARQSVENGITEVIATPHGSSADLAVQLAKRDIGMAELQEVLRRQDIPLTLIPGLEYNADGHSNTAALETPGCRCGTSPNAPLLVELPFTLDISFAANILFRAQIKGVTLVLAHPERYHGFVKNEAMFVDLLDKGIYLQFNAPSFKSSFFFRAIPKAMLRLIAHAPENVLIGSDAHNPDVRPGGFGNASRVVCDSLGEEVWRKMTDETPRRLLGLNV